MQVVLFFVKAHLPAIAALCTCPVYLHLLTITDTNTKVFNCNHTTCCILKIEYLPNFVGEIKL